MSESTLLSEKRERERNFFSLYRLFVTSSPAETLTLTLSHIAPSSILPLLFRGTFLRLSPEYFAEMSIFVCYIHNNMCDIIIYLIILIQQLMANLNKIIYVGKDSLISRNRLRLGISKVLDTKTKDKFLQQKDTRTQFDQRNSSLNNHRISLVTAHV